MISQDNVFGYQVPDSQHANSEKMLCTINSMNEIRKHLNEDLSAGSNRRIKRRRGLQGARSTTHAHHAIEVRRGQDLLRYLRRHWIITTRASIIIHELA